MVRPQTGLPTVPSSGPSASPQPSPAGPDPVPGYGVRVLKRIWTWLQGPVSNPWVGLVDNP